MNIGFSGLKRPKYPMPDFVKSALEERSLMAAYRERPAYQQNDYIGWIMRAKRYSRRSHPRPSATRDSSRCFAARGSGNS